jgi:hypothetical protein
MDRRIDPLNVDVESLLAEAPALVTSAARLEPL